MNIALQNIRLDHLKNLYQPFCVEVDVLRLDLVHPVVSGNKWFKLRYCIDDAIKKGKNKLVSFGGAYSNHILATAAAAKEHGLKSIGIIRGERPAQLNDTLKDALSFGMELIFISREAFKTKTFPDAITSDKTAYIIAEGGYSIRGREGVESIFNLIDSRNYSDIIAAVGTGTTLAGLINGAAEHMRVTGVSVLKNNNSISQAVNELLPLEKHNSFSLRNDFHFGGYAKFNKELIGFMNDWFSKTRIPSDFVYTGKLFYAIDSLMKEKYFPPGSRLLVIHSGGLQGNRSLPAGTLIF